MSEKLSLHSSIAPCDREPEPPYSESALFPITAPPSPSLFPPQAPPPFSSLYSLPQFSDRVDYSVIEPAPNPPPPFTSVSAPEEQRKPETGPSGLKAETKAALPADNKGDRGKGTEGEEPPPPYTEGSSPLSSFNYIMAAAGGAASIITQVQQGAPPPVNALSGKSIYKTATAMDIETCQLTFVISRCIWRREHNT